MDNQFQKIQNPECSMSSGFKHWLSGKKKDQFVYT